jgi:hypothetical protein
VKQISGRVQGAQRFGVRAPPSRVARLAGVPLLYVSRHFKEHREEYYERLQRIRTHGEWEEWIRFFLDGVARIAEPADETAAALMCLFEKDRVRIIEAGGKSTLHVYDVARQKAFVSIPEAERLLSSPIDAERGSAPNMAGEIHDVKRGETRRTLPSSAMGSFHEDLEAARYLDRPRRAVRRMRCGGRGLRIDDDQCGGPRCRG